MLGHHRLRAAVQVARAAVVAQAAPQRQHIVCRGRGQGLNVGKALQETLVTGEFNESREGQLCQELARNEFKITQAEKVMLANRADPLGNIPNVARFTAAIAEQNAIIAKMKEMTPCKP